MRPRGGLTPIVVNVSQETRVNGSGESKEYEHEKNLEQLAAGIVPRRKCHPSTLSSMKKRMKRRKRPSSPYAL